MRISLRTALTTLCVLATLVCEAENSASSGVEGYWLGSLSVANQTLRIQITLKRNASGAPLCSLDSLDQRAFGLPCTLSVSGADATIEVPAVRGKWTGKLSDNGQSLQGTWSQGVPLPLDLNRQQQPQALPASPKMAFSPALPPASAAKMEAILNKDLEHALNLGVLAPKSPVGVTVGFVRNGERHVLKFGAAQVDSIFEIGSITKTFTGLLLAQMIEQKKVSMDAAVHEFLPAGTVPVPAGKEITLLDLVTQHSGLPRLPDNLQPADPKNPYADYGVKQLYQFLAAHGVERPADAGFLYSNLGVGLLGQLLSNQAGVAYADLVKLQITAPLQLHDTVVALSPEQNRRFIPGLGFDRNPSQPWDLNALAGAGALRSTAADLLTYLEANLHPDKFAAAAGPAHGLAAAMALSHEPRADAGALRIAFAWLYDSAKGSYWHNGGTGGFSSFVLFNPAQDCAVVVLVNLSPGGQGSLADALGGHIAQRFAGAEAISLADW